MARLRERPDDLLALVGDASVDLGLQQSWVEKDFWIVELLRSVGKPIDDVRPVFKGGTSLSKAYGLVERFSEDVDILIVLTREMSASFGMGTIDARLKEIVGRVDEDLGIASNLITATKGVKRYASYEYPTRVSADSIARRVVLEMGRRGSDLPPAEPMSVTSYVAQYVKKSHLADPSDFEELEEVRIPVLRPERTLFEKLELLHDACSRYPDPRSEEALGKAGRHLYDVTMLLRAQPILDALQADPDLPLRLDEEIAVVSEKWGFSYTPRPRGGFVESAAFDPGAASTESFRTAYRSIRELVYGHLPSFDECIATVHSQAQHL